LAEHDPLFVSLQDRFRVDRELGRGGFAVVYLAHDLRHDRPVALKILHAEVAASLGVERFEREIKLAARLQHPHILGVFDSGTADGRLWFAMPFIEGESLRDKLAREGQLPIPEAINLAREVADALGYAHQHGVIHRDIKPENILLGGRHAMVADFGIARAIAGDTTGTLTLTGTSIGTPGYMSPEQATGERIVDARTDIYSLGCVLYETLAGAPPFAGANARAIIARMMTEAPRSLRTIREGVSEELEAVIFRALARTPADRYASAAEFMDALTNASSVASTAASHVSAVAPATVAATPNGKRTSTLSVFAFGLLVGLGALFAWRSSHGDRLGRGLVVLPFENLGAAEDAYFADGITEEIRGKLAAIPGIRVTARTSSNTYRNTKKSVEEIGGELGVEYLLTGTIRWEHGADGQRHVRVTPELIKATDGSAKWQQPFDAVLSDVFTVQSSIAEQVAQALDVTLASQVQQKLQTRSTKNVDAYQEFLLGEKATEGMARSDAKSLAEGEAHYDRAVALDTAFGLAWSRVAFVAISNFNVNPSEENARKAADAVNRAMRLEPDNAQVRRAHSRYLRIVTKNYAGSLAQLDTGLMREPNNTDLLATASAISGLLSRWDAAVDYAKRAYALDPRNPNAANAVARILHATRHYAESEQYVVKALALSPGNISYTEDRVINLISMGNLPAAKAAVHETLAKADSTELAAYFALFQEMQWVLDEPLQRRIIAMTPANFRNNRQQWALKVGATWNLLGDSAKGRAYGDSARIVAEAQLSSYPEDAQLHELRARSLALTTRKSEAVEEAERALKMRETALDASTGPYVRYQAARVFVQAGAYDRALDIIEPLLTTNYADITPAWLRLEPVFLPLRGNARFERITRQ
ncbi:MAG TPA: protein kinase, partial [Gemmatimonadaceae bacterium]|nr:protein kinase [Gemmatimonadaceae bacterium]